MIRECTKEDMEMLTGYLEDTEYGARILEAVRRYGFQERFLTVYVDVREGQCEAVYLWLYGNLLLFSRTGQIGIDFLEQTFGIEAPELVAGPKDNVNIVSWLLTDYYRRDGVPMPVLRDREGNPVEGLFGVGASSGIYAQAQGEEQDSSETLPRSQWSVLTREMPEEAEEAAEDERTVPEVEV